MGKPAARIGDMHVCPMVTGTVPHVGGPVMGPAVPTVLIGGMPAAVMGDMCTCAGPPDSIVMGSTGVFIGKKPAARMGDPTVHGGRVVVGCPTVLIGEIKSGGPQGPIAPFMMNAALGALPGGAGVMAAQIITMKQAAANGTPFCEVCAKIAAGAKKAWNYVRHTSINLGGDVEISAGLQAGAKASVLGAGLGAKANASSLKLAGAEGKIGASMAEGFKNDGEVSWVGKKKTYEVSQELAAEVGVGGGVAHTAKYKKGETIRAIVKDVKKGNGSPQIIISRSDNIFLRRLFEIEIPEIYDGIIEIKSIAREPGERAKVAVESQDKRIDAVGACVGMKGVRIHAIVRELNNEKVDIIPKGQIGRSEHSLIDVLIERLQNIAGGTYNLTINEAGSRGNVVMDFALLRALARG